MKLVRIEQPMPLQMTMDPRRAHAKPLADVQVQEDASALPSLEHQEGVDLDGRVSDPKIINAPRMVAIDLDATMYGPSIVHHAPKAMQSIAHASEPHMPLEVRHAQPQQWASSAACLSISERWQDIQIDAKQTYMAVPSARVASHAQGWVRQHDGKDDVRAKDPGTGFNPQSLHLASPMPSLAEPSTVPSPPHMGAEMTRNIVIRPTWPAWMPHLASVAPGMHHVGGLYFPMPTSHGLQVPSTNAPPQHLGSASAMQVAAPRRVANVPPPPPRAPRCQQAHPQFDHCAPAPPSQPLLQGNDTIHDGWQKGFSHNDAQEKGLVVEPPPLYSLPLTDGKGEGERMEASNRIPGLPRLSLLAHEVGPPLDSQATRSKKRHTSSERREGCDRARQPEFGIIDVGGQQEELAQRNAKNQFGGQCTLDDEWHRLFDARVAPSKGDTLQRDDPKASEPLHLQGEPAPHGCAHQP